MDAAALKERTMTRNDALWTSWDVDGLTGGLGALENLVNRVSRDMIRMPVAVIEGAAKFHAEQRDKLQEVELQEVETHTLIAKNKYETQMQVLAYKMAGEEVLIRAKGYDVAVQSFIMAAKEFAAEVEREQIALQRDRAKMDIKKEEAHQEEVKSRILLEYVERAHVEVDIARARLQVAQANVRAVMAGIEAEEAELKAIQAELEVAMVQAEKATLIADIAMVYASIIVRGLAKIKLAVDTAEIEAGFTFIQQKLDDLLMLWDTKLSIEKLRTTYEALLRQEVIEQTAATKAGEDLRVTAQKADVEVFYFEKDKVDGNDRIPEMRPGGRSPEDKQIIHDALQGTVFEGAGLSITDCEALRQDNLYDEKAALFESKADAEKGMDNIRFWAEILIAKAHGAVQGYKTTFDYEDRIFSQKIHKGFFVVSIPGSPAGLPRTPPQASIPNREVAEETCPAPGYQSPEDM